VYCVRKFTWLSFHHSWVVITVMKKANVEQLVRITIMWWPAIDKHTTATTAAVNYNTIVQYCIIRFPCLVTVSIPFSSVKEAHGNCIEQPIGCNSKNKAANNNNAKLACKNSSPREYFVHCNLIWLS